ncbi:MAG: ATP-binding protein [Pseudomonadota bacterium]
MPQVYLKQKKKLRYIIGAQVIGLTLLLAVSLALSLRHGNEAADALALTSARVSAQKDLKYRDYLISQGSLYLAVSPDVTPDPLLAHHPDRDVLTPVGKQLTLVTPQRLISFVFKHGRKSAGRPAPSMKSVVGQGNMSPADSWEQEALELLQKGAPEAFAFVTDKGGGYLRYMAPVCATESCVRNRPGEGLQVGDLMAGMSIWLEMAPFDAARRSHFMIAVLMHVVFFGIGLIGIGASYFSLRKRDVSLEKARLEIHAAWEDLSRLFEASPVGMLKLTLAGEIVKANRAFEKIIEGQAGDYCGRKFDEVVVIKNNGNCCLDALARVTGGEDVATCEVAIDTPGGLRYYTFVVSPLAGKGVGADAVIATFTDITERKENEIRTREAMEELSRTFDAIGEIITVQDKDMRITKVNRATCLTFGLTEKELVGRYCYEVFRGASVPCPNCPELRALKDGAVHSDVIEHENLAKTFAVSAAPILDSGGGVVKVVHYAKDVTENIKLEKQLRQAQKMEAIGTLAGGIAHDFNNILTAIMGFAELAKMDLPPESQARGDIDEVIKGSVRARELVRQILTFSRQADHEISPLEIKMMVKEALKLLRASIPATIELRPDIDEKCGLVMADPSHIHQVVMNLCTNSFQAMKEKGGILSVSLAPIDLGAEELENKIDLAPGRYIRLVVSDTGSGMDARTRERIFEPYFTTKKTGEGTGLGLSVVHGIVKGIGGHISVYSEPGQGTVFHVYFPAFVQQDVGGEDIRTSQIPAGSERIMLLDDEKEVVASEARILESLGYKVEGFTSCKEALETFRQHPDRYDLLITDMTMPLITGADFAAAVRAMHSDIPIIVCTGFSEVISRDNMEELGVDSLLLKPVTLVELAQTVRKVLDEKK